MKRARDAYSVIRVLEKAHGVLDDNLVFETNELGHLFSDPWFDDL